MEQVKFEPPEENAPEGSGWFSPPIFSNSPDAEEKTRTGRLLFDILRITFLASIIGIFLRLLSPNPIPWLIISAVIIAIQFAALILLRSGRVMLASVVITSLFWLLGAIVSLFSGGISSPMFFALLIAIIAAGMLIGRRAIIIFTATSVVWGLFLYMLDVQESLPAPLIATQLLAELIIPAVIFSVAGGLIYLMIQNLRESLQRARINEQAQIKINQELQAMRASLENQVNERTKDIVQRSAYLQASIEVSRAAASILDSNQLISQAVELIREQFNLYYVGLFLTDELGEWAVLKAGTGAAGEAMLKRTHRIAIGTGMIGWSIANSSPRVALDTADDTVRLAIQELPDTRSEAAIPLISRGKILGALTIQSAQSNAFGEVEITIFQSLADQLAISLDNANLYAESQSALMEIQRVYGEASQQAWQKMLQSGMDFGYRYSGLTINPLESQWTPEMRQVVHTGKSLVVQKDHSENLMLPISVRNQVVGIINLTRDITPESLYVAGRARGWSEDEINLLESLMEQLGLALDSARLYQDTQRNALREKMIGDVTAHIRETLDVETVLKTAVQEIQRTTSGAPQIVISLAPPKDSTSTT